MLVSLKLYNSWNVGSLSVKYERANSAYLREPKTYNTIDEDFRLTDDIDKIIENVNINVIEQTEKNNEEGIEIIEIKNEENIKI